MTLRTKIKEIVDAHDFMNNKNDKTVNQIMRAVDDYYDGFHPTHRHRKGNDYQVIFKGLLQTDVPLSDNEMMNVYRNHSGVIWIRSEREFNDGRFTPINSIEKQSLGSDNMPYYIEQSVSEIEIIDQLKD